MKVIVEIAKLKSRVPEEEIEVVILKLLLAKKIHKNSIILIPSVKHPEINIFQEDLHSITLNDVPVSCFWLHFAMMI